jgi:TolB-like protein/DNA-binding CsgD family transcriptional regulator/Tfp pilus assembly protein PilF
LDRIEVGMTFFARLSGRAGHEAPLRLKDGDAFSLCQEQYGITAREGEIVRLLIEGRTNEEIAARLFISDHTVKNHVHNVYQKLGVRNRVQLIQRFRSALEEAGPPSSVPRRGRPRHTKLLAPALIVVLIAAAAAAYLLFGPGKRSPRAAAPRRSIAVLPFTDLSATKDFEYLCDGLAETLIDALTRIDGLWVPARTSSFFFKGKTRDLQDIGSKLGVETVLEGSVQVAGDNLRITARIDNVRDGRQIWSEIFDFKKADLFVIQDDIAKKIVGALKLTLLKEPVLRRYTQSLESYDRYMKGIFFYNKRGQENLEKALGFFRSAIELDPNYALAYAWTAETYTVIGSWGYLPPREAFSEAREAALEALKMDDTLAEAHSALADVTYLYDWEWDKAEAEYEKALTSNPNYAVAHSSYAQFLACQARFDESLEQHWRARGLDPLSLMIRSTMANTLVWMGQYDQAESELGKVLEMDPGYAPALEYLHQARLRRSLSAGNFAGALEESRKAGDPLGMGIAYARMGNRPEALKIAEQYAASSRNDPNEAYAAAIVLFALGENDRGFELLNRAGDDRSRRMVYLKTAPYFDTVRQDPRFQALLRKVGLGK